jgi:hypothetical protein
LQQLEKGEITVIEAIDTLLSEKYATRETRRIDVVLRTAKLLPKGSTSGSNCRLTANGPLGWPRSMRVQLALAHHRPSHDHTPVLLAEGEV